jgi:hypothetical protein
MSACKYLLILLMTLFQMFNSMMDIIDIKLSVSFSIAQRYLFLFRSIKNPTVLNLKIQMAATFISSYSSISKFFIQ